MTKEQLTASGIAAFGPRWQTDIADALGVSDRTVRNWVSGKYQIPSTVSADIVLMLKRRRNEIDEAIIMTTEKFLQNPFTGSVDTEENWFSEIPTWEVDPELSDEDARKERLRQFDTLVEVVKDESGQWVKV
jgi:hypothetical protein